MKPIIFVLGLSGIGKDYVCNLLKENYMFCHLDMDLKPNQVFRCHNFPQEWRDWVHDSSYINFKDLAKHIRSNCLSHHIGAVLSFPATYVFDSEQLNAALEEGIGTILLWGPLKFCWMERYRRQVLQRKKEKITRDYFYKKYLSTYCIYKCLDYDSFRAMNYDITRDKLRPSNDILLSRILERLNKQGLQFFC